jgi:hypothetical protein
MAGAVDIPLFLLYAFVRQTGKLFEQTNTILIKKNPFLRSYYVIKKYRISPNFMELRR